MTAGAGAPGAPSVIDLNADLGESFGAWRLGDDEALLQLVTSANLACGFHAGDPLTIRRACALAVAGGVTIGAQVSYQDLAGFGRREMVVPPEELEAGILYQIAAVDGVARAEGGRVRYVKPHGALYNRAVWDPVQAGAIAAAVRSYDRGLPVLTLPGSALAAAARRGRARRHRRGVRRPRLQRGRDAGRRAACRARVLTDPGAVAARVTSLVTTGTLTAADGSALRLAARSLCVHGDTPGAVTLARAVRAAIEAAGVELAPFA